MGEVGEHVTPGATEDALGKEKVMLRGSVYFTTAGTTISEIGQGTITGIRAQVGEKHRAEPGIQFHIAVVGHASSRWLSAGSEAQEDELNLALSRQRAETVDTQLQSELAGEEMAPGSFVLALDAAGDQESEELGLGETDNTWVMRRVDIVVRTTSPSTA